MKIKTTELTGWQLDWAVAKADGRAISYDGIAHWVSDDRGHGVIGPGIRAAGRLCGYSPSTQGGDAYPVIEREGILLRPIRKEGHSFDGLWLAKLDHGNTGETVRWVEFQFKDESRRRYWRGGTALVAAMRCFVASKLGAEVDVPEELLK